MASNIDKIARRFKLDLERKTAARKGDKMSRKQILKSVSKTKAKYKEFREKLHSLETELERVESEINECRDGVHESRSSMLKMNRVLQNMDLTDVNHAVFYASDVGYIMDGDEHYLDVNDAGDVSYITMKERRSQQRAERRQDTNDADADFDPHQEPPEPPGPTDPDPAPEPPDLTGDEDDLDDEDVSEADDSYYIPHSNFRFFD